MSQLRPSRGSLGHSILHNPPLLPITNHFDSILVLKSVRNTVRQTSAIIVAEILRIYSFYSSYSGKVVWRSFAQLTNRLTDFAGNLMEIRQDTAEPGT